MKPRRVMVSIETETIIPLIKLRSATHMTLYDRLSVLCDQGIEQIQVNVIQRPKAAKKLVRT